MKRIWPVFVCESLSSVGTSLLMVGIFFYTQHRFGWGLRGNFFLAAGEGAAYVIGSLTAEKLAKRFGRRGMLVPMFVLAACFAASGVMVSSGAVLFAILVAYTFCISTTWPAIESLATANVPAEAMSRRVGVYNLVWSGTNMLAFAISGAIIEYAPRWLFFLPACVHLGGAIAVKFMGTTKSQASNSSHVAAENELMRSRTLALWLSRICLPATYVVIYSLMAMMPSLVVVKALSPAQATVIGCVWMLARWIAFVVLGATVWWHTRPRVLLAAGCVMLAAFIGVTIHENLAGMIVWQIALGMSLGVIYAASLYFGMVLSDGSTEHGGYHEALIGLGSVLGPGVGALVQWQWAGSSSASVAGVSGVVLVSLVAAGVVGARLQRAPSGE